MWLMDIPFRLADVIEEFSIGQAILQAAEENGTFAQTYYFPTLTSGVPIPEYCTGFDLVDFFVSQQVYATSDIISIDDILDCIQRMEEEHYAPYEHTLQERCTTSLGDLLAIMLDVDDEGAEPCRESQLLLAEFAQLWMIVRSKLLKICRKEVARIEGRKAKINA